MGGADEADAHDGAEAGPEVAGAAPDAFPDIVADTPACEVDATADVATAVHVADDEATPAVAAACELVVVPGAAFTPRDVQPDAKSSVAHNAAAVARLIDPL